MKHKWFFLLAILALLAGGLGARPTPANAATTYVTYVVQSGDTLGKIANAYCTTWQAIYDLNRDTIGDNPNVIKPGMVLTIPANCTPGGGGVTPTPSPSGVYDRGPMTYASGTFNSPYYTVAWGDTLSGIGQRFGVPYQDIASANGITNNQIYAGQVLYIPGYSGTTPPPATVPERVYFAQGAVSATRSGVIYQGAAKSYILGASAGQTMTVTTYSHGEPLTISIKSPTGSLLALSGTNGQISNSVSAKLPSTGDYIVTVTPVTKPESPSLAFDITFVIN